MAYVIEKIANLEKKEYRQMKLMRCSNWKLNLNSNGTGFDFQAFLGISDGSIMVYHGDDEEKGISLSLNAHRIKLDLKSGKHAWQILVLWGCLLGISKLNRLVVYSLDDLHEKRGKCLTETKDVVEFYCHEQARTCVVVQRGGIVVYAVTRMGRFDCIGVHMREVMPQVVVCLECQDAFIVAKDNAKFINLDHGRAYENHVVEDKGEQIVLAIAIRQQFDADEVVFAVCRFRGKIIENKKSARHKWNVAPAQNVKWKQPPIEVQFHSPYILCLYENQMHVRDAYHLTVCQTLNVASSYALGTALDDSWWYINSENTISRCIQNEIETISKDVNCRAALGATIAATNVRNRQEKIAQLIKHFGIELMMTSEYEMAIKCFNHSNELAEFCILTYLAPIMQMNANQIKMKKLVSYALSWLGDIWDEQSLHWHRKYDTLMLKLCVYRNDDFANQLLNKICNAKNCCDVLESIAILKQLKERSILLAFVQQKGQHRLALELLSNAPEMEEVLLMYMKFLIGSQCKLVLEFAKPLMLHQQEALMKVFHQCTQPDSILKITTFLNSCQRSLTNACIVVTSTNNGNSLAINYLFDTLVQNKNEFQFAHLHEMLLHSLVEHGTRMIDNSNMQNSNHKVFRDKLQFFLAYSNQYNPARMLGKLAMNFMFERAIVLEKLKLHAAVFQIYICELDRLDLAEEYCNRCYTSHMSHEPVYDTLFQVLLQHKHSETFLFLSKYSPRMDPVQTLHMLPEDTNISSLQNFFVTILRAQSTRNLAIRKALLKKKYLDTQYKLNHNVQEYSILSQNSTCVQCKSQLQYGKLMLQPDGNWIHPSCATIEQI